MNDREKYEFELLENRVYKLERLLLASNRLEVIETILKTNDDISADNITSGTLDKDYIDSGIARDIELVDTTEIVAAPDGGKNGDMWYNPNGADVYIKIAGTWRQVS